MAGRNTISTQGTTFSRLSAYDMGPVQGVIFAMPGAGHAVRAALIVNIHSERRDKSAQVYNGAYGTVSGAVYHSSFFPGDQNNNSKTNNPKTSSNQGS